MTSRAERFIGNTRFRVERRLGSGGFGVVYLAYDREREAQVALKVLRQASGEALYRFKREFRALADLVHPNLVVLYELLSSDGLWFFTMERVDGLPLFERLRGPGARPDERTTRSQLGAWRDDDEREVPDPAEPPLDHELVRAVFRQVADALRVLHAAGKLHCDVKPSNVLVTDAGRAVVLDFGLVADQARARASPPDEVAGTPAYMSPEQARGAAMTTACDWYSVGVMLYEVLTGRRPFEGPGRFADMLRGVEPPPPSRLVAETPADLDALCRDLLRFDPAARPRGDEIRRRIAGDGRVVAAHGAAAGPEAGPFVGRDRALGALREAFAAVRNGRPVALLVEGRSGLGKTRLVRRFLEERTAAGDALVLSGRCYEREAVPYKALDSAVDCLSQHLKEQPADELRALLPRNVAALARLFPVLRRLEVIEAATHDPLADVADPGELRRRASAALRELLGRLARRLPVVLVIDDMQWSDVDSAALVADLLRPPDAPPLLIVGCHRSEDAAASPLGRVLRSPAAGTVEVRDVVLSELDPADACALAEGLLGDHAEAADAIARESGGSPMFIAELVRHRVGITAAGGPPGTSRAFRLEALIHSRVGQLPEEARRLLETIAVAGRPIDTAVAVRAAKVADAGPSALAVLHADRLVRTLGAGESGRVETYHDRIRETVMANLPSDVRGSRHRDLALVLEASQAADPEALCVHFDEAGEPARAAGYAAVAADQAAHALAFDRAARLYRFALERGARDADAWRLQIGLGDALSNAGRGEEAADAYVEAARRAPADVALEVRRRAAENLLRSGHIDRGLAVMREVLAPLGLKLAETPRRALLSLLIQHTRLALRGLGFTEHPASAVPADELIRIDTCWSVAMGLSFVDNVRGAEFQKRHVLLALRAGEPYRVARALAAETGYVSTAGSRGRGRTEELLQRTAALAERVGHPHAIGLASFCAGIARFQDGRFREARDCCLRALEILRERCTGVAWELDTMQFYWLLSLVFLGELRELARHLPPLIDEARARGDLFAEMCLTVRIGTVLGLAADVAGPTRRQIQELRARWSQRGFHTPHYYALVAEAEMDLYEGHGTALWTRVQAATPALRRSLLLRVQSARIRWTELRGRSALAAAEDAAKPAPLWRAVEREAKALLGERTAWGDAPARLLQAGLAAARGDEATARGRLEGAIAGFQAMDMKLYAAAARRRLGELVAGERGAAVIAEADSWMQGQGVRSPAAMAHALAPGFRRRGRPVQ